MGKTVITFGTYDLFHYGHLRIIQRARQLGDRLVVGVSSDALNYSKKAEYPAVPQDHRMAVVKAITGVDEVFLEESLEKKPEYCRRYNADIMVMGDDHLGRFDDILRGICECRYLPRTQDVSSTGLKKSISNDMLLKEASPSKQRPIDQAYSAAGKNLVHATSHNIVFDLLIRAHDAYYDLVMVACTPFCRVMPRTIGGVTVFTANIVTYGRGLLVVPIALCMKYSYLGWASFLIMWHDFLDHLDGVVAKQHARDGRNIQDVKRGYDGALGAFLDAQMDKVVFCLCLWSYLLLCAYDTSELGLRAVVVVCSLALFALEFTIGCVRFGDYYRAKFAPPSDAKSPALRAVSEGKLKQKFESVGLALYALTLPDPALPEVRTYVHAGTVCLLFAVYFSWQSLQHKLRARGARAQ